MTQKTYTGAVLSSTGVPVFQIIYIPVFVSFRSDTFLYLFNFHNQAL